MKIIVSCVIGGELISGNGMEKVLHQLIIEMRKSLKKQFDSKTFDGLDKTKINLYISGNVSEFCSQSGIAKCQYVLKKKEIISEFCIDRYYWTSEPVLDLKKKFLSFMDNSLTNLSLSIKEKLKVKGLDFDSELFKETFLNSLIGL